MKTNIKTILIYTIIIALIVGAALVYIFNFSPNIAPDNTITLEETIDTQNDTISNLEESITKQKTTIDDLEVTIGNLEKSLDTQTYTIDYQETDIDNLEKDIDSYKETIDNLENIIENQKSLINSQKTDSNNLEEYTASYNATIANKNNIIDNQEDTISNLENTITNQEKLISNLEKTIANLQETINELRASINNQQSTVTPEVVDTKVVVGIGCGTDFAETTRQAIENAGGLSSIIKAGDTVLIKPNITQESYPSQAIITDYRVVAEIIQIARECGATKIIIGESTGNGPTIFAQKTGYPSLAATDVELVDFNNCTRDECYWLIPDNPYPAYAKYELPIPKIYMDADVVISAAKLKTHSEAGATYTLKNSFGVPPAPFLRTTGIYKSVLHDNGLAVSIVTLNQIRTPDFGIVDGILGGEGDGPINVDPVNSNTIFASTDCVACDTVCMNFMGLTFSDVPHIQMANDKGLGECDLAEINVVGAVLDDIKMNFKKAN